ncbi:porin [Undibacterium sp. Di26W]|uniref:porin n=1 Tax=Undibacterium sp. Di26W TaxID=3413035 RepID=UPI003BF23DD8
MKKSFLALALMSAFSGAAFAQSSVTIYGIVDAGFQSLDNGTVAGRFNKLQSGQENGSRLGFKGTEDLGGGLKANFVLEMGLNVDDGSSAQGRTFGRRSTVGLSGDFGSVDLGRDKTPTFKFFDNFDPFASGYINSGSGLSSLYFIGGTATVAGANANSSGRASNAIYYYTPGNLNGFSAVGQYGFGEAAGDNSAGRSLGLNLRYTANGLDVGYSFVKDNGQAAVGGPVNARKGNTLAASYDFGVAKPVLIYQKVSDDAVLAVDQKIFTVGVTVPFDATNKVLATYSKIKDSTRLSAATTDTVGDAKQFAVGYQYTFSKRTDLYAAFASTSQDANSQKVGAAIKGADVKELTFGVRHQF